MSDPVLYRTPVVDANGKLTREWVRFFDALAVATGTITNIQNTTVIQGQVSAFDDVPQRDTQREITNALLGIYPDTPQPVTADPLAALALIDTPQPQTSDPLATLALMDTRSPQPLDPMVTLGLFEPRPPTLVAGTNVTLSETAGTVTINATGGSGAVSSVFGRTGDVLAVATDYPAFVASGASHAQGMVPDPGATAGSTKYLREDGTWAVAAQLNGTNTWTNAQTFSQTVTCSLSLRASAFSPNCRTVTTATDTCSASTDHTLILNGVTTESLPASPGTSGNVNFEFHFINIGGSAATISGNGHNIWVNGVSAATISLAPNASIVLQYDLTGTIWRAIGDPGGAAAALLSSANTFSSTNQFNGAVTLGASLALGGQSVTGTGNFTGATISTGLTKAATVNPVLTFSTTDGTNPFQLVLMQFTNTAWGFSSVEQNTSFRAIALNPSGGNTLIGTSTDNATDKLQVAGSGSFTGVVKVGSAAPATSTSAGVAGSITWDSGFLYVAVATNSWKRVALTTF